MTLTRTHTISKNRSKRHKTARGEVSIKKLKKDLEALQKSLTIQFYGSDCYTCDQKDLTGANRQLGHVPWPRSILSTVCKYDTDFTRIQCFRCNIHLGGMGAVAAKKMQKQDIDLDALWAKNQETKGKTVPRSWFENKIKEYKSLLASNT